MKKENVVVKKNTSEHLAPGGRGWHVVPGEGILNKEHFIGTPSSPRWGTSPARGEVNGGFTLIELLVVVLIIGILAAVAVPQYKLAVVKSKTKAILPVLSAIQRAQEMYYLNNGQYVKNVQALDIQMPAECIPTSDRNTNWVCGKDFHVVTNTYGAITANYCPGHNASISDCKDYRDFVIRWAFDHCSEENCGEEEKHPTKERVCKVHNDSALGEKICKTFFGN